MVSFVYVTMKKCAQAQGLCPASGLNVRKYLAEKLDTSRTIIHQLGCFFIFCTQ